MKRDSSIKSFVDKCVLFFKRMEELGYGKIYQDSMRQRFILPELDEGPVTLQNVPPAVRRDVRDLVIQDPEPFYMARLRVPELWSSHPGLEVLLGQLFKTEPEPYLLPSRNIRAEEAPIIQALIAIGQ